ncbi:RNA-binding S4 domain-containing protein [Phaeovulum sp. W22_SRMD_FR3]|uniref:RNA-binding S4 domain-containing protein n=1 Tax=Phaeovulum sp. W22_SRMD_FR3 TaxID=3240274 RepID=UPI003F9D8843
MSGAGSERIRIDKWLWHARFFKSRGLAAGAITSGAVRVNGQHAERASRLVGPGDVLTFVQGGRVRVVRLNTIAEARAGAALAQQLYTDLQPVPAPRDAAPGAAASAPEGAAVPVTPDAPERPF